MFRSVIQYPSVTNKCPRYKNNQKHMYVTEKQFCGMKEIIACNGGVAKNVGADYGKQIFCSKGTGGAGGTS